MGVNNNISELFELVNHYPSPHNGQPIRLKQNNQKLEIFFEKDRGLQATDISYIFSFVSMGVFISHLKYCARALGHSLDIKIDLPHETQLKGGGLVKFAEANIIFGTTERDRELIKNIENRQTSRKKYHSGISAESLNKLTHITKKNGMNLLALDSAQTHKTIWLNQRAVFDDLFDEPVRQELNKWLRYSKAQKFSTKDGLAYDAMELNGVALKYIVRHPSFLRWPVVSTLLKKYYLRTMEDSSTVLYLLAPFKSELDSFKVGETIMSVWLECTIQGYFIHPFGTIVSNEKAHNDFLRIARIENENRENKYVCFIFRAGESEAPVQSLRLPIEDHLIKE